MATTSTTSLELVCRPLLVDLEWDHFLNGVAGSRFEQHSGWGSVRASYGWNVERWAFCAENHIVGGLQILTRRLRHLGTIGYICGGPVVSARYPQLEEALALHAEELAERRRWLYCVFDYSYFSHELASAMARRGFSSHPSGIPPSGMLDATLLIDLLASEEEILARMNISVRRNIRRSLKAGLSFAEGTGTDIPNFRELMLATCARRGCAPTPPQPDHFKRLWNAMNPQGAARLFMVKYGDQVVSAAFAFTISDTVRVWKVGWSGELGNKDPNHFMWWQMIRWAKSQGFSALDFVWIDSADARRAAQGERSPEGFRDGTSYFKLGFGPRIVFPPPVQSKFFHPVARFAHSFGGRRVLASRTFQQLLARYWSKASGN